MPKTYCLGKCSFAFGLLMFRGFSDFSQHISSRKNTVRTLSSVVTLLVALLAGVMNVNQVPSLATWQRQGDCRKKYKPKINGRIANYTV